MGKIFKIIYRIFKKVDKQVDKLGNAIFNQKNWHFFLDTYFFWTVRKVLPRNIVRSVEAVVEGVIYQNMFTSVYMLCKYAYIYAMAPFLKKKR